MTLQRCPYTSLFTRRILRTDFFLRGCVFGYIRYPRCEGPDFAINPWILNHCPFIRMQFLNIASFCLSVIGTYGIVYSLRLLLPRNVIPHVSVALDEATLLLESAEDVNALPNTSEYRATLTMYEVVLTHLRPHRVTDQSQHSKPSRAVSYGESPSSRSFPTTSACLSFRSDLQALWHFLSDRGNSAEDRGSSGHFIAHHLTDMAFSAGGRRTTPCFDYRCIVSILQRCLVP